jgi:hypothetical protein
MNPSRPILANSIVRPSGHDFSDRIQAAARGPSVLSEDSGAALAEIAVLVQDGAALVMGADTFRAHLDRSVALRDLVASYGRTVLRAIAQAGACNGIHSVEERLCLGLLVACDRIRMEEVPLTQDSFARALAVRRPTVSLVMNSLQKAGLIECGRGRTRVLGRSGLEAISCECYATLRNREPWVTINELSANDQFHGAPLTINTPPGASCISRPCKPSS